MSLDATEVSIIPLRSRHRAQQPPAIGSRIGAVAVEESDIELGERQETYKVSPHNGQRLYEI